MVSGVKGIYSFEEKLVNGRWVDLESFDCMVYFVWVRIKCYGRSLSVFCL